MDDGNEHNKQEKSDQKLLVILPIITVVIIALIILIFLLRGSTNTNDENNNIITEDNNIITEDNITIEEDKVENDLEKEEEKFNTTIIPDRILYVTASVSSRLGPDNSFDTSNRLNYGDRVVITGIVKSYNNKECLYYQLDDGTYINGNYVSNSNPLEENNSNNKNNNDSTTRVEYVYVNNDKDTSNKDSILKEENNITTEKEEHTHKFNEVFRKDASCINTGIITYSCSCGYSYNQEIATKNHSFIEVSRVNPSCTSFGHITYRCSCGYSYTDGLNKINHKYSETSKVNPTCTSEGKIIYTCDCGASKSENLSKVPHSYEESNKVESSCTSNGSITYQCVCGNTKTTTLNKTNHTFIDGECTSCGEKQEIETPDEPEPDEPEPEEPEPEEPEPHVHDFKETNRIDSTCAFRGQVVYECDCGKIKLETLDKADHSYINDKCKWCNLLNPEHVHSYTEKYRVEASCDSDGLSIEECICGDIREIPIVSTGHSYKNNTCTVCGKEDPNKVDYVKLRSTAGENSSSSGFLGSNVENTKYVRRNILSVSIYPDSSYAAGHYVTDDNCWDVSEAQDGSIIAWEDSYNTTNGYNIFIAPTQPNTKIQAHENSNFMFTGLKIIEVGGEPLGATHGNRRIGGINNIDFSNTTSIDYMFSYSTLSKITELPSELDFSSIPTGFFAGCGSLISYEFPDETTEIGASAFSSSGLTSITIPSRITKIGKSAFLNSKLTSATLEDPSGWKVGTSEDAINKELSPSDLSVSDTLITYLKTKYAYYIWSK